MSWTSCLFSDGHESCWASADGCSCGWWIHTMYHGNVGTVSFVRRTLLADGRVAELAAWRGPAIKETEDPCLELSSNYCIPWMGSPMSVARRAFTPPRRQSGPHWVFLAPEDFLLFDLKLCPSSPRCFSPVCPQPPSPQHLCKYPIAIPQTRQDGCQQF